MMLRLILAILFMSFSKLMALEFACNFEEVYADGQTQQGTVLIKNENIRYEYLDKNLYTIIYKNGETTISTNTNRKQANTFNQNDNLIRHLIEITQDYPLLKNVYNINDFRIIVEKSNEINFIRRLAIASNNLNLSIYFQNCRSGEILDLYFQHYPYFRFGFS